MLKILYTVHNCVLHNITTPEFTTVEFRKKCPSLKS